MVLGEAWRPWRSVAARLFWHDYLARRRTVAAPAVQADTRM
jgi:3-methyladenine DNA glycosylase/8-oxoguanine DNA glycosylase